MANPVLKTSIRSNYPNYRTRPEFRRRAATTGEGRRMTPVPLTARQLVAMNLQFALIAYIEGNDLGVVLAAPINVAFSNKDVVQPDLVYLSKARRGILREAIIKGPPDLVVEVLSPSTDRRDLGMKKKLYPQHAVQEYWIVDPVAQTARVLSWSEIGFVSVATYPRQGILYSPLLPTLAIPLEKVFRPRR